MRLSSNILEKNKILSVGVSKIDFFRHLGMEGETVGMFPNDYALATPWSTPEISLLRNILKVFPLCPDFT